jgi:hypothetical protein
MVSPEKTESRKSNKPPRRSIKDKEKKMSPPIAFMRGINQLRAESRSELVRTLYAKNKDFLYL